MEFGLSKLKDLGYTFGIAKTQAVIVVVLKEEVPAHPLKHFTEWRAFPFINSMKMQHTRLRTSQRSVL